MVVMRRVIVFMRAPFFWSLLCSQSRGISSDDTKRPAGRPLRRERRAPIPVLRRGPLVCAANCAGRNRRRMYLFRGTHRPEWADWGAAIIALTLPAAAPAQQPTSWALY